MRIHIKPFTFNSGPPLTQRQKLNRLTILVVVVAAALLAFALLFQDR